MEGSGKTWSWAWLLMGDGSKQGRGEVENGIPGRKILQTDIFELIWSLLLCYLTSYKSQNCFYPYSSVHHLVHKYVTRDC